MNRKKIEKIIREYAETELFNELPPPPTGIIQINSMGMVVMDFETFKAILKGHMATDVDFLIAALEERMKTTGFYKEGHGHGGN